MAQTPALSSSLRSASPAGSFPMSASTGVPVVVSKLCCCAVPTSAVVTIASIHHCPLTKVSSTCRLLVYRVGRVLLHPTRPRNPVDGRQISLEAASVQHLRVAGRLLSYRVCTTVSLCRGKSSWHLLVYTGNALARAGVPAWLLPVRRNLLSF